jgi:hypothetical protein
MAIEAIRDILLEDTFVFAWHRTRDRLDFRVLASLLPTHAHATSPAPGDWACYLPAIISFQDVTSVQGLLDIASIRPAIDADGTKDYGCIDELVQLGPGEYRITGEFGTVSIAARDVSLDLVPE